MFLPVRPFCASFDKSRVVPGTFAKVSLSNQRGPATYHTYGLATLIDLEPTDKFTIVVNSENYYKQFIGSPPKNLRANLYVMLIDLEEGRIIKEEKICEYY